MSTVQQLSRSASERPFARSSAPGVRGRSGACRALFEPMDHEELEREMESKLLEMCERDRRRWNFDFETDTPLRGEYEWEAVGVGETPVFYRGSAVRGGDAAGDASGAHRPPRGVCGISADRERQFQLRLLTSNNTCDTVVATGCRVELTRAPLHHPQQIITRKSGEVRR
uniref:Cyclin-dependent kinase inhibitor 1Ca n=1 Tax=Scleropages formosus TaxID=113540 RepID=A0A8C9T279_SCLFO